MLDKTKRIIMISNRLPVTIKEKNGEIEYEASSGGLATGLSSFYQDYNVLWVGWPGHVSKENQARVEKDLLEKYNCLPVFLSEKLIEKYYEGFSNRTIWPLFHLFQGYVKYSASDWIAYKEANNKFLQAIEKILQPQHDLIWVHDYQLILLPSLIKEKFFTATVGWFLHIPFPNYDIFRLLPQHKAILKSLMSADLVGFHTHDYTRNFLECVRRIYGYESRLSQLIVGDRIVQVGVFPMGIDYEQFSHASTQVSGSNIDSEIKKGFETTKLIFTVSRLDYTKGIPQSLSAIEFLLKQYPEWHGKIQFLLVVVPSREKVDRYAGLKREIDELVGRINSSFGSIDWTPIRYIYRSLSFEELIALYQNADIAFITPLRDGMNLIAKEYVATRNQEDGVLVLSEMAGAAKELIEAITVNPNSQEDMADALHRALIMPKDEQQRRIQSMRLRVSTHDVRKWAEDFIRRLRKCVEVVQSFQGRKLDQVKQELFLNQFKKAQSKLIILDYDGTLVPFVQNPSQAKPDERVLSILERLTSDSSLKVVILSGRDRHTLNAWLSHLPLMLVAEHGGWVKESKESEWESCFPALEHRWKKEVLPVLESFVESIPGSFIEEKDHSLVWHYRKADPESASSAAKDLLDALVGVIGSLGVQVLPGRKNVEVRSVGVSKAAFYVKAFSNKSYDLICGIGDDFTDEELFSVLPAEAYSIKVGTSFSRARFILGSYEEVRNFLDKIMR